MADDFDNRDDFDSEEELDVDEAIEGELAEGEGAGESLDAEAASAASTMSEEAVARSLAELRGFLENDASRIRCAVLALSGLDADGDYDAMAALLAADKLVRRVSMCVVELAERGAHATSGGLLLGRPAKENEARPL